MNVFENSNEICSMIFCHSPTATTTRTGKVIGFALSVEWKHYKEARRIVDVYQKLDLIISKLRPSSTFNSTVMVFIVTIKCTSLIKMDIALAKLGELLFRHLQLVQGSRVIPN